MKTWDIIIKILNFKIWNYTNGDKINLSPIVLNEQCRISFSDNLLKCVSNIYNLLRNLKEIIKVFGHTTLNGN